VCVECGEELLEERAALGYEYCTRKQCQAKRHRGLKVTTVGVNKSADRLIIAGKGDLEGRAGAGEFAAKDTGLGTGYRGLVTGSTGQPARPVPRVAVARSAPPRRPWTRQQEQIVRLYHDMGLSPPRIVERARQNTPALGITAGLVVKILSAPPRR
jgi:hypothetical protein